MQINALADEFVPRPAGLMGAKIFAFRMVGDSMVPWRRPDELVLCHRTRQPIAGNHVVVVLTDEDDDGSSLAAVGVLVSRDEDEVVVEQYSPADTLRFPTRSVASLFRVIEWQDAFGLVS